MKFLKVLLLVFLFLPIYSCTKTYIKPLTLDYKITSPAIAEGDNNITLAIVLAKEREKRDFGIYIDDLVAETYGPNYQVHHLFTRDFMPLVKGNVISDLYNILQHKSIVVKNIYNYLDDVTLSEKKYIDYILIPMVSIEPIVDNLREKLPGILSGAVLGDDGTIYFKVTFDLYFTDPNTGETVVHKSDIFSTDTFRYYGGDEAVEISVSAIETVYPQLMELIYNSIDNFELLNKKR